MTGVLRTIETQEGLRVFRDALRGSGLAEVLGAGHYTLFVPTDDAFAELPAGEVAALFAHPPRLAGLMTRHVAPGRWSAAQLLRAGRVDLLCGHAAHVELCDGLLLVRSEHHLEHEATVVRPDVNAGNNVLHLLDTVL